jgi:hypothetical protein
MKFCHHMKDSNSLAVFGSVFAAWPRPTVTSTPLRHKQPDGKRLGDDVKRRRPHQLSIRLPGKRRSGLDSYIPSAAVEH